MKKFLISAISALTAVIVGGLLKTAVFDAPGAQLVSPQELEAMILARPEAELFTEIKGLFPQEYAAFLEEIANMVSAPNRSNRPGFSRGLEFTAGLRTENIHLLRVAPLDEARDVLRGTLAVLESLEDRPDTCARFAAFGGQSLRTEELLPKDGKAMTGAATATFRAIAAGRDRPVSHDSPDDADYKVVFDAWVAAAAPDSPTQSLMIRGDWQQPGYCAAITSWRTSLLNGDTPSHDRVTVALASAEAE